MSSYSTQAGLLFSSATLLAINEIEQIPDSLKTKTDESVNLESQANIQLTNENTQLKANIERYEFELEKQGLEFQAKMQEANTLSEQIRAQLNGLESQLSQCQQQLVQVQAEYSTSRQETETLKLSCHKASLEKEDLAEQLSKRRKEIDQMTEEIKKLNDTIKEGKEKVYETISKVEDSEMKDIDSKHKIRKLEQEKELLKSQLMEYETDTTLKRQEILKLKKERSSSWLDMQTELDQVTDERDELQQASMEARATSEQQASRLESLASQLRGAKDQLAQMEEQSHLELSTQAKLAALYKDASEESSGRVTGLLKSVEEMRQLLNHAREEHERLEKSHQDSAFQWQQDLEAKNKAVEDLRMELQHANELLSKGGVHEEGLEQMFPMAAATSKALQSGLSLTQLYSQHLRAQEDLHQARLEGQHLQDSLHQLISEVEEKTPLINQQLAEREQALERVQALQSQLESVVVEQEKVLTERDEAVRARNHMQREVERQRQRTADLSNQVCALLQEVEEARGSNVLRDQNVSSSSHSEESSANLLISQRLVTFKSIQGLQEKNDQLLTVVRDLTRAQEEQENNSAELKNQELQDRLNRNMAELEDLQKDRTRQVEYVEAIIQQRDMYRMLVDTQENANDSFSTSSPISVKRTKLSESPEASSSEAHSLLKQLQEDFDLYKKEKAENTRLMEEQLEKLRDEISDFRIQNSKLNSQLEYSEERFNLLRTNAAAFKKEANSLHERNQKLSATIAQNQASINTLRNDALTSQEKLSRCEVALETTRSERDHLKAVEARLTQEREALHREQQHYSRLLANIQTVQTNLERLESEAYHQSRSHIERLEKEATSLRTKLDSETERYQASLKTWEKRAEDLQLKLDKEIELGHKTHDELVESNSLVHGLKLRLSESEAKLSNQSRNNSSSQASSLTQQQLRTLKTQLTEAQTERQNLQEKLSSLQKSNEQLQTLSQDLEMRLKEQTNICQQFKTSTEKSQLVNKEERVKLESQVALFEKQLKEITEAKDALEEEFKTKETSMGKEIDHLKEQQDILSKNESVARLDCHQQASQLKEAQDKYERELRLHSEAVQQLKLHKEKLEGFEETVHTSQSEARQAKQGLEDKMAGWENLENQLRVELAAHGQRSQELQAQNDILHQQMEMLSAQMAAINKKDWSKFSEQGTAGTSLGEGVAELHDVIRFLRKEKDIAVTEADSVQKANTRLQSQVHHLSKQKEELEKELGDERHHSQSTSLTNAKHSELLKKVEMLNVLTDSNRVLRSDKEILAQTSREQETKLEEIKKQLEPLRATNRDLSSQVDALDAERQALRGEVTRWQTRVNTLLEQKASPEDISNLTKQKEDLQTRLNVLQEEALRKQADLISSLASAKKDLEVSQKEVETMRAGEEITKTQLQTSQTQAAQEKADLYKIKRIARKYKAQYDELKVQHDDLTMKHPQQLSSLSTTIKNQDEELSSLRTILKNYEDHKKTSSEETDKLKQKVEECLKNEERLKRNLMNSTNKITDLTNLNEDLTIRSTSLEKSAEEKSVLIGSLKSMYEAKQENELKKYKEALDKLEKQVEGLKNQQSPISIQAQAKGTVSKPLAANVNPTVIPSGPFANPPTENIRSLAIGSSPSQTSRMALVPPASSEDHTNPHPTVAVSSEVSSTSIPVISMKENEVSENERTPSSSTEMVVVSPSHPSTPDIRDQDEIPPSNPVIVEPQTTKAALKRPLSSQSSPNEESPKRIRMANEASQADLQPATTIQSKQPQATQSNATKEEPFPTVDSSNSSQVAALENQDAENREILEEEHILMVENEEDENMERNEEVEGKKSVNEGEQMQEADSCLAPDEDMLDSDKKQDEEEEDNNEKSENIDQGESQGSVILEREDNAVPARTIDSLGSRPLRGSSQIGNQRGVRTFPRRSQTIFRGTNPHRIQSFHPGGRVFRGNKSRGFPGGRPFQGQLSSGPPETHRGEGHFQTPQHMFGGQESQDQNPGQEADISPWITDPSVWTSPSSHRRNNTYR